MRKSSVSDALYSSPQVRLRIFSTKNLGQIILMKYACKIRVWKGRQLAESGGPKPKLEGLRTYFLQACFSGTVIGEWLTDFCEKCFYRMLQASNILFLLQNVNCVSP